MWSKLIVWDREREKKVENEKKKKKLIRYSELRVTMKRNALAVLMTEEDGGGVYWVLFEQVGVVERLYRLYAAKQCIG